jgi:sialate O-acetylesterase
MILSRNRHRSARGSSGEMDIKPRERASSVRSSFMAKMRVDFQKLLLRMMSIIMVVLVMVGGGIASGAAGSGIAFAPAFGDNMVLQREMPLPVWGRAEPGGRITVEFAGQKQTANADAGGNWQVTLEPLPASREPRTLSVSVADVPNSAPGTARLTNVLVGEVWLAAGQSNMEWPLAREAHAATELPAATNASLRLLNLPFAGQYFYARPFGSNEIARMTPEKFYSGEWQSCSPASAKDFSAIAYYFGREVRQELNVPVGIIHLAVGGSPTEAWIRRAALAGVPELRAMTHGSWLTNASLDDWCRERGLQNLDPPIRSGLSVPGDDLGPNYHFKPGFLWEAGPARLLPFAVRGVLWYQGESNSLEPRRVAQHEKLFPLLVRDWRAQWGRPRLPFLYCQLSSISTNGGYKSAGWPEFRDQQRRFLEMIPDTAMAVTSDLGHPTDVHPRNKRDVGHRLALAALARVYKCNIEFNGPLVSITERRGDQAVVRFQHAQGLKTTDGEPPNHFEVAGADGTFFPATAAIENDAVVLMCAQVPRPVVVRYAWQPYPKPVQNLVNAARLPASTFRLEVNH